MSQGIPKSVRDLLARQVAADEHPSPDLLNGYTEQSLTASEMSQVTNHLVACKDCREVVFLASAVKEEPVLAAVAAAMPAQQDQVAGAASRRKRNWMWWKWALPAFAVVAIAVGGLIERSHLLAPARPEVREMIAMNRPAPTTAEKAETTTESTTPPTPPPATGALQAKQSESRQQTAGAARSIAKVEQLQRDQKDAARRRAVEFDKMASLESPRPNAVVLGGALPRSQPKPAAPAQAAGATSQTAEVTSVAPLVQADNANLSTNFATSTPNGGNDLTYLQKPPATLKSGLPSSNEAAAAPSVAGLVAHKKILLHAQWRITEEGHLERQLPGSTWTRVLSDQPVVFRVVATIGTEVWAGGSAGALFHSADQGAIWTKIALSSKGQIEQGTVTSIRFDSPQHGSVSTDSGTTWVTSDGGQTWIKQYATPCG